MQDVSRDPASLFGREERYDIPDILRLGYALQCLHAVRAPFFVIQQMLPILTTGSSVVVTTSLAAHTGVEGLAAYAMTKGALDTMVKHFALTLGVRGIRVNAVAPGIVATDMSAFTKTDQGRAYATSVDGEQLVKVFYSRFLDAGGSLLT